MGFSSDEAGVANQLITTVNLPSVEETELFEDRLESLLRDISTVVNTKEGGLYNLNEVLSFKQYFTTSDPQKFRNVYRKTFDLVALNGGNIAAAATFVTPHGITSIQDAIMIYVSCVTTDPEYFTAVFPDVFLDATDINFTNSHASAVSSAIAVCEYTKS